MTMEELVEEDRFLLPERVVRPLDPYLNEFFEKHMGSFPAVDIGAGKAVLTIGMALNFRPPLHKGALVWYPSDYADTEEGTERKGSLEENTRDSLRYHLEETRDVKTKLASL